MFRSHTNEDRSIHYRGSTYNGPNWNVLDIFNLQPSPSQRKLSSTMSAVVSFTAPARQYSMYPVATIINMLAKLSMSITSAATRYAPYHTQTSLRLEKMMQPTVYSTVLYSSILTHIIFQRTPPDKWHERINGHSMADSWENFFCSTYHAFFIIEYCNH